jgi:hypothetical protein
MRSRAGSRKCGFIGILREPEVVADRADECRRNGSYRRRIRPPIPAAFLVPLATFICGVSISPLEQFSMAANANVAVASWQRVRNF